MNGIDEFLKLFGNITILHVVEVICAIIFLVFVYKRIRDYFNKKHDAQLRKEEIKKRRDEQINRRRQYGIKLWSRLSSTPFFTIFNNVLFKIVYYFFYFFIQNCICFDVFRKTQVAF